MRLKFLSAATVLLLTIHCAAAEQIGGEKTLSCVALGEQPYNLPDDGIKFDRLIAAVNELKPAFTLHVGDIKSARIPCSNEIFNQALARLQTFEGALVYTIGDNEWTAANGKIGGPLTQRMRKKIDDGGFQTPYRLRKQVVEPVFGQIKQARGFR